MSSHISQVSASRTSAAGPGGHVSSTSFEKTSSSSHGHPPMHPPGGEQGPGDTQGQNGGADMLQQLMEMFKNLMQMMSQSGQQGGGGPGGPGGGGPMG